MSLKHRPIFASPSLKLEASVLARLIVWALGMELGSSCLHGKHSGLWHPSSSGSEFLYCCGRLPVLSPDALCDSHQGLFILFPPHASETHLFCLQSITSSKLSP